MAIKLKLDNSALQTDATQSSYLAEPAVVGDAQIFVQSYVGLADNQILLLEDFGTETAEIVTVNGTPSVGGGVVLDTVLVRSHPVGARVYVLDYDQIELSHATTSAGSKTALTTTLGSGLVSIQADVKVQIYNETEYSSGYYFARYKNSITGTFSGYTDALVYGGWDKNTVGYMIDRALSDVGEKLSEKVTRFDCYEWINTGLKLIQGKLKRWPEHYVYNYTLPTTITDATITYALPTTIYDTETNKSILGVRIEDVDLPLTYIDPIAFSELDATETGDPTRFTVRNGLLALWPTPDGHTGDDIYMNYATVITMVDSDGDTIDLQRYDMVQNYLAWRIKMKARNNGTLDQTDGYYLTFKECMNDAIRTLPGNNVFKIRPSVNRIGNTRT